MTDNNFPAAGSPTSPAGSNSRIKVLIVEDSPTAREFLIFAFTADPDIEVVGTAVNGGEALEAVKKLRPDVITMDIHMPVMNGFDATRAIMENQPTPIVIVSASTSAMEVVYTFRALEAGALAVILRPPGIGHPEHESSTRELIRTVKLISEIKVVKRTPGSNKKDGLPPALVSPVSEAVPDIQVAAIGASTGGPPVLRTILSGLPRDLPFPLLIVQHIAAGFVQGFAEWLSSTSRFPVRIAAHDEPALPGHGYVAPDGFHLGVAPGPRILLSDHEPENGLRPSAAYLFRSAARVFGPRAVGVLLTGMGRDGAAELKEMRENGAITIAQDKESSVVHGMPGEAIRLEAASLVLPPEAIVDFFNNLALKKGGGNGPQFQS